jgi:glycosyltransferase involved in cell wall biosynthesis
MRVALTHQHFFAYGGAERVLEALALLYPEADIFCMAMNPEMIPAALKNRRITTSFIDSLPTGRKYYRHWAVLAPMAAENLDLSNYDLIISSDGTFTKGIITNDTSLHLCYCHSPHRSLWDRFGEYRSVLPLQIRIPFLLSSHYLRNWDFNAAQRIDKFIANSLYIQRRIHKYYKRDSTVVYPPVDINKGFISPTTDDYYLSVGRLDTIKRTEILVEACNSLSRRLIIVGEGPEMSRLKRMAGKSIQFTGWVSDSELSSLYARCRACLFAADEDLGLVPIEAQSYGRPVLAFGVGGALETVIPNVGGLLFSEQNSESLAAKILEFEHNEELFNPEQIKQNVVKFGVESFQHGIREVVEQELHKRSMGQRRDAYSVSGRP